MKCGLWNVGFSYLWKKSCYAESGGIGDGVLLIWKVNNINSLPFQRVFGVLLFPIFLLYFICDGGGNLTVNSQHNKAPTIALLFAYHVKNYLYFNCYFCSRILNISIISIS